MEQYEHMTFQPFSRFRRIAVKVLPILSVAAIAFTGSVILQGTHAETVSPSDVGVSNTVFATSIDNDYCKIQVQNAHVTSANGNTRVSIDVRIDNHDRRPLQIAPGLQFTLIDKRGKTYKYTAQYLPVGVDVGGPIAAGAHATEHLDFSLPAGAVPRVLSIQFDASRPTFTLGLPL